MKVPKVSIIIVNYNTKDSIQRCLASIIERTEGITYEIIVCDNASTDGSQEVIKNKFPKVKFIQNTQNLGFGAANNKARHAARGEYILFLNSDTMLQNNAAKIFYDFWEDNKNKENIGALGCNLLNGEGNTAASHGNFFNFKQDFLHYIKVYISLFLYLFGIKIKREKNYKKTFGTVDVIIGAALFIKNNADAEFDERYFLYHEEADLQLRLAQKGKKRLLIEGPRIIHFGNNSNVDNSFKCFASYGKICDYISRIIYYRKHKNRLQMFLLKAATLLIFTFLPLLPYTKKHLKKLIAS